MRAIDNHQQVILVLLDLTAAFDTIDHSILIQRLKTRYGVKDDALKWFQSYVDGRTQFVKVMNASSEPVKLEYGVPQGTVFAPVLFVLYAAPIEDIIQKHELEFMLFADDTQIYFICRNANESKSKIENCVDEIREWMILNKLVLNDNKTEVIHIRTRFQAIETMSSLRVGECDVQPSKCVRDLGFYFDDTATYSSHVSSICKASSFALYRISKIRNVLDQPTTEKLIMLSLPLD